jgi:hypothetical protein
VSGELTARCANQEQARLLAFVVYEIRLLLAGQLGPDGPTDAPVRAAAHLAYALHNQALAVLAGRTFDTDAAVQAMATVDGLLGEKFVQRFMKAAQGAG